MGTSSDRGGAAASPRARREEKRKEAAPAPPREPEGDDEKKPIVPSLFNALFEAVDHFGSASLDGSVAFVIFAALRALLVMVDRWGTPEAERIYGVALQLGRADTDAHPAADAPPASARAERRPKTVGDLYGAALRASLGTSGRFLYDDKGMDATAGDLLLCALSGRGFDDTNLDAFQTARAELTELMDVLWEPATDKDSAYWRLEKISIRLRVLEILHARVLGTPVPVGVDITGVNIAALQAKNARAAIWEASAYLDELHRLVDLAFAPPGKRTGTTPSERKAHRLSLREDARAEARDARAALAAADAHLSQLDWTPDRAPDEVAPPAPSQEDTRERARKNLERMGFPPESLVQGPSARPGRA